MIEVDLEKTVLVLVEMKIDKDLVGVITDLDLTETTVDRVLVEMIIDLDLIETTVDQVLVEIVEIALEIIRKITNLQRDIKFDIPLFYLLSLICCFIMVNGSGL